MALPDTETPACPLHETYMVPHSFEPDEIKGVQGRVNGFRCPDPNCSIVYVKGALEGFYTVESHGELKPYLKSASTQAD